RPATTARMFRRTFIRVIPPCGGAARQMEAARPDGSRRVLDGGHDGGGRGGRAHTPRSRSAGGAEAGWLGGGLGRRSAGSPGEPSVDEAGLKELDRGLEPA